MPAYALRLAWSTKTAPTLPHATRPGRLPAPGLPVLHEPDTVGAEPEPSRLGQQACWRLLHRLLGQIERAPVDRYEMATPDVSQHLQCLLGGGVARLHDHRRQVRADGNLRHGEGVEPSPDLLVPVVRSRVGILIQPLSSDRDGSAAPEA